MKVSIYRGPRNGLNVVGRNFILLLLNFSAWLCLGPAWQDLQISPGPLYFHAMVLYIYIWITIIQTITKYRVQTEVSSTHHYIATNDIRKESAKRFFGRRPRPSERRLSIASEGRAARKWDAIHVRACMQRALSPGGRSIGRRASTSGKDLGFQASDRDEN